jgi:hypothetical protein
MRQFATDLRQIPNLIPLRSGLVLWLTALFFWLVAEKGNQQAQRRC